MDAIDILGSLLGKKSKRGGLGGQILESIVKGATRRGSSPTSAPSSSPRGSSGGRAGGQYAPHDPNQLDDLLRDAWKRNFDSPGSSAPPPRRPDPSPRSSSDWSAPPSRRPEQGRIPNPSPTRDDQAMLLVRAMINAAKADGQIDQEEQAEILQQFGGDPSRSEVQFLRNEFSAELDVRDFAWDVPIGQEQSVYAVSLMAIDLDQNREAHYLKELAHGLRIPPEVCNQIHDRYGAPRIH